MSRPVDSLKDVVKGLSGEKAFLYVAKSREVASRGIDVVSFGIGQPDIPTFDHIIEAAKEALDRRVTGYTETAGIPELREAIAEYLNIRYGAGVKPSEVVATTGAKTAIFLAIAAYVRPGDEVIIPDPTYPAYPEVTKLFGGKPVYLPLQFSEDRGFEIDLKKLEELITDRTRMIVLNNPHNPTGAVFTPREVEKILEIAKDHKILVLADEIYDNFVYGEVPFRSVLEDPEWKSVVLYVNGFSKTFSMTGWRLGYVVAAENVARYLTTLATNVYSCPPSFVQVAGVKAIRGDWSPVREMVRVFKERRDFIVEKLREIPGFEVWRSAGAFYVFPRIKKLLDRVGMDVEEFVDHLLYNYGVVMLPGTAFSETEIGKEFVRLSFAIDIKRIEEGLARVRRAVEKLLESR